jgi:hypothetical protein
MAARSLRAQLNQIRAWVREGRTDAWIAHQLEIPAAELRDFRRRHGLSPDSAPAAADDLRDVIEAEVEAATLAADDEEDEDEDDEEDEDRDEEDEDSERGSTEGGGKRRRRRRGGRGRRGGKRLEASFDHGETDGYGLWLDASVKDNPVYTEHWAGKRDVTVRIEADQIVIRRAGSPAAENGDGGGESDDSDE